MCYLVIQVHDRMTECVYLSKLESFKNDVVPEPVIQIPVIEVSEASTLYVEFLVHQYFIL